MPYSANPDCLVSTKRVFSATPREIFMAFENPKHLAQWWGPQGFTSTFETFDFKPNGRWVFVMHGPDGANYFNESVFREIQPDTCIIVEHVVQPWFTLRVTLTSLGDQTLLNWDQEFKNPEIAESMRQLSKTANEQVLDRLQSLLAEQHA